MMKFLPSFVMFICSGVAAAGQTPPPAPKAPSIPKVIAEISAGSEKVVKGAPFSAEAVSESVQTLADGNRIVRRWTNKLYRNSEGRFRREGSGSPGSALGSFMMLDRGVTILDPVAGSRHLLNDDSRTVRTFTLRTPAVIVNGEGEAVVGKAVAAAKVATELSAKIAASVTLGPMAVAKNAVQKWESRTEQLGVQNIEGIDAEGTRTVTTIPADAIGNERPIEIVYERWYSRELQLIVSSRHYDPRFGEQTYRLANIVRSEPDPSLFELPAGYKVVNEGAGLFKVTAPAKIAVQKVAPAKAAPAAPAPKPQL